MTVIHIPFNCFLQDKIKLLQRVGSGRDPLKTRATAREKVTNDEMCYDLTYISDMTYVFISDIMIPLTQIA